MRSRLPRIVTLLILWSAFITAPLVSTSSFSQVTGSDGFQHFKQIQAFNCDFDDNIFVTGARIWIWDNVNQKELGISTANWALIKGMVGKPGPLQNFSLKDNAFRDFGDSGPDGQNTFKMQIIRALEKGDDSWKGPSWNAFVEALTKPETRDFASIITARLHSPQSILEGLQVLVDRGLLPALPRMENVFTVAWPGLSDQFKAPTPAESKTKVMKYLLDRIESQPVRPGAAEVMNREGTGLAKLDLWGFSDDDYGNFTAAVEALSKEVAAGKWPHVKIVLYYTGLNNPDHQPHSVVIKPDGTTRPTLPSEDAGELILKNLKTPGQAKRDLDMLLQNCDSALRSSLGSFRFLALDPLC